ncbi:hypothetical protein GE09DRAFT_1174621 [Coniochaeta sp. 2T2.1]|nr:hypothetical protein GE09DRAFT_1174621 [Coniochaeta sp. 2T2.1]
MSNDPLGRRILPQQTSQMGTFSFAPQTYQQPRETQKNYVFVDEHNRHKRLKVMRACEGCRRRKIKCDAATTNTWPCSACIRLKLHCVRPNGFDGATDTQVYETTQQQYDTMNAQDGYQQQPQLQEQQLMAGMPKQGSSSLYPPQQGYSNPQQLYQPYPESSGMQQNLHYADLQTPVNVVDPSYAPQASFPTPPLQQSSRPGSSPESSYTQDPYSQHDLADLLGSLKVNEAGTAPYLNSKMRRKTVGEEEPAATEEADEFKSMLPPLATGPGLKIRIPPALMPDEETILHYFDLYFTNVHPYVPVLDKSQFYQQWQSNRESISPLILEAIFAIAGRLADEPAQGQQWLALATRHADSFMDVPRLTTLQASLIILKARESAPKRGYYYRSWMSIVQCVQMGKDLGLDEHHEDHQAGQPCGFSSAECMLRTRIWQTIFVCETMIGSPQGRTDLQVEVESVDFGVPRPAPNVDESEYHVSKNFVYFARIVRSISRMNSIYARLKKTKDWGIDPEFVQLNPQTHQWLTDLPPDMTVSYPADGSPPWLPSPFIGNLHSYYYLSLILFHRPQLAFLEPAGVDGQWKQHMLICYNSAKMLCRLQEGVLQAFGLAGLQCMQRGINFTIYAILGCIVLHLVALTSPDPELSSDAREYFTRHMRILEKCMSAWPMPDMQKQVDAVREAFSADTRKPFVLKPSFPYGSPVSTHSSPPRSTSGYPTDLVRSSSMDQRLDTQVQQHSYGGHPISPPISAGPGDMKTDASDVQSMVMMSGNQGSQAPAMQHGLPLAGAPTWNPSRIFDQWNTSFGTPPAQPPPASSQGSSLSMSSSGVAEVPTAQDIQTVHSQLPGGSQQIPPPVYSAPPTQTFVTPAMWQESVASVYEGGLKRAWDYDGGMSMNNKRR